MKISQKDRELASRFPDKPNSIGFGVSPSEAKISADELKRLLDLGLIECCRGNSTSSEREGFGWKRRHSYFIRKPTK